MNGPRFGPSKGLAGVVLAVALLAFPVAVPSVANAASCVRPPVADLSLKQSSGPSGPNVVYILTVSNAGPCPAQPVTITDLLPSGFTFVGFISNDPGNWECSSSEGIVTCTLATLAPIGTLKPGSATVSIIASPPENPSNITNDAIVGAPQEDPDCSPPTFCPGTDSDNESFAGFLGSSGGTVSTGHPSPSIQTSSVTRPNSGNVTIQQLAQFNGPPPPCNPCLGDVITVSTPSVQFLTLVFNIPAPPNESPPQVKVFHLPDGSQNWMNVPPCPGDPCVQSVKQIFSDAGGATSSYFQITVISSTNGGWGNR